MYYFRRKIPLDLREAFGRPQLYVSLNTQDRCCAIVNARKIAARVDELFAMIRTMDDKPDFKLTPLGQIIEKRLTEAPLKERIEELRDQLLDQQVQANRHLRQVNEWHENTLSLVVKAKSGPAAPPISDVTDRAPSSSSGTTIRQARKAFYAKSDFKPLTKKRYAPIHEEFATYFGEEQILANITQSKFEEFTQSLRIDKRAARTVTLYINTISGLLSWSRSHFDDIPDLRTAGLKSKRAVSAKDDRAAYGLEELQVLMEFGAKRSRIYLHSFLSCSLLGFLMPDFQRVSSNLLN